MVSKTKLYMKLDILEKELQDRLIPHLENAASGKNDLVFCVSAFNSARNLKLKTDRETEALVDLGAEILSLKKKLGEVSKVSIAERICWYCREWSSTKNQHSSSSGQGLAKQFLAEIR